MMHIPHIKAIVLVVSDKQIFSCFLYIKKKVDMSLCETWDPKDRPIFGLRGII